jgi:hypothetical protein
MGVEMRKTIAMLTMCFAVVLGVGTPAVADSDARPFKGSVSGEVAFVPVDAELCPQSELLFGSLKSSAAGTGTITHLGKTRMTAEHCTPAGDLITGGEMTLVAANGDVVYLEYAGMIPFPGPEVQIGDVFSGNLEFTIVGGTGRFDDAAGEGTITAYVTFGGLGSPVWPGATWTYEGTIAY